MHERDAELIVKAWHCRAGAGRVAALDGIDCRIEDIFLRRDWLNCRAECEELLRMTVASIKTLKISPINVLAFRPSALRLPPLT